MSQLHLLAQYESLVQQHQAQSNPTLTQLQASVNETLHHLQQQEQTLVDAQVQPLSQLKHNWQRCELLALTPQMVQFHYPTAEAIA